MSEAFLVIAKAVLQAGWSLIGDCIINSIFGKK